MAGTLKLFPGLSKSEISDLADAKSEMSGRYLQPRAVATAAALTGGRAFRATPVELATQNVVGVGIDEKYVEGKPTGVHVVKFLVRTKVAPTALTSAEKLPKTIGGIPTDVEEVGMIVPQRVTKKSAKKLAASTVLPNPRTKLRPAQPGSSVGFRDPADGFTMAGTFGLLVKDAAGTIYVLSNNHVIAFENGVMADGTKRTALAPGAPIFQPGLLDGGKIATDQIAELTRWIDLRADRNDNDVDGAIAQALKKSLVSRDILFIGPPNDAVAAAPDMVVHKFGRTTSYTAGRVTSVMFDVTVPYEVGDVMFADQIAIRGLNGSRFSDAGDSGSAIIERASSNVVGLLFAGATNGSLTFANHIGDVLRRLKVTLA